MSRSRCAWIWRGSAVGLSRSSGIFMVPARQAILALFEVWSRANWPDSARPFPGPNSRRRRPEYNGPGSRALAAHGPPRQRGAHMAAGEAPIKQAVKWIDDQLHDNPGVDRVKLVDEASRRFDLSPLDADFLFRHLAERAQKK